MEIYEKRKRSISCRRWLSFTELSLISFLSLTWFSGISCAFEINHNSPISFNAGSSQRTRISGTELLARSVGNDEEWKFFDTARLNVSGGNGGKGCVAFLRLKGEPLGGPAGGGGGKGGDVYLICDEGINTLAPVRNKVHVRATHGRGGLGKSKDGCNGKDIYVRGEVK